jgi:hypothetical protein
MLQVVLHSSPASDAPQRNPFVSFLSHLSLEASFGHLWYLIRSRCTHVLPSDRQDIFYTTHSGALKEYLNFPSLRGIAEPRAFGELPVLELTHGSV